MKRFFQAVSIFSGIFLLVQIQPILLYVLHSYYGNGPGVWSISLLFFQFVFLMGVVYASLLLRVLSPRKQVSVHVTLLYVSLFLVPIAPDSHNFNGSESPTWGSLVFLFTSVGLPFLLLSSTVPLLQTWVLQEKKEDPPGLMFSIGVALLGLLAYSFFVEPAMSLRMQTWIWSVGYFVYAISFAFCTWQLGFVRRKMLATHFFINVENLKKLPKLKSFSLDSVRPFIRGGDFHPYSWLALSACGSVLLMSGTNQFANNFASISFLWIIPLVLYLLSFMLVFWNDRVYDRRLWTPAFLIGLGAALFLIFSEKELPLLVQLSIHGYSIFVFGMICHGELKHLRPPSEKMFFYSLMIASGCVLGSLFVALIAPSIFDDGLEYQLGLVVLTFLLWRQLLAHGSIRQQKRRRVLHFSCMLVFVSLCVALLLGQSEKNDVIKVRRNVYGILRVQELSPGTKYHRKVLFRGTELQGLQFQKKSRRQRAATYYSKRSGVGLALRKHPKRQKDSSALKVGVLGLGTGVLASYSKKGDLFRFYEKNPDVVDLAESQFRFLRNSRGKTMVIAGDGRRNLEKELANSMQFDVLVVDLLANDAGPAHLLSREALETYFSHLAPDGILALHITNENFDWKPLLATHARLFHREALLVNHKKRKKYEESSSWVLLSDNLEFSRNKTVRKYAQPLSDTKNIVWTDGDHSVFPLMK